MVRYDDLAKTESLSELADAFDDVTGVTATLYRADDSPHSGANDTVTIEAASEVDLESIVRPVRHSCLYVFATEVFADGTSEATVNHPDDLEWL
jgi:hypothetical protein